MTEVTDAPQIKNESEDQARAGTTGSPGYCFAVAGVEGDVVFKHLADALDALGKAGRPARAIAVGSPAEVDLAVDRLHTGYAFDEFEDVTGDEVIVAMSLDAFLELEIRGVSQDRLVLWADPVLAVADDAFEAMALDVLSPATPVLAGSHEGAREWPRRAGREAPALHFTARREKPTGKIEPLIDKTSAVRLLIDAADDPSSGVLVEPFIAAEHASYEVWCMFPGALRSWMKPDLQISSVPSDEQDIYFASVDAVLVTSAGGGFEDRLASYQAQKVALISADDKVEAELAELLGGPRVAGPLSSGPLADRLKRALKDRATLASLLKGAAPGAAPARRTASAKDGLERLDIAAASLSATGDMRQPLSNAASLLLDRYLEAKYETTAAKAGAPTGLESTRGRVSRLFRSRERLASRPMALGNLRGWAMHSERGEAVDLVVLAADGVQPCRSIQQERPDVAKALSTNQSGVGFECAFAFPQTADLSAPDAELWRTALLAAVAPSGQAAAPIQFEPPISEPAFGKWLSRLTNEQGERVPAAPEAFRSYIDESAIRRGMAFRVDQGDVDVAPRISFGSHSLGEVVLKSPGVSLVVVRDGLGTVMPVKLQPLGYGLLGLDAEARGEIAGADEAWLWTPGDDVGRAWMLSPPD